MEPFDASPVHWYLIWVNATLAGMCLATNMCSAGGSVKGACWISPTRKPRSGGMDSWIRCAESKYHIPEVYCGREFHILLTICSCTLTSLIPRPVWNKSGNEASTLNITDFAVNSFLLSCHVIWLSSSDSCLWYWRLEVWCSWTLHAGDNLPPGGAGAGHQEKVLWSILRWHLWLHPTEVGQRQTHHV